VRHLSLDEVEGLISAHTDGRSLGVLGEPGVNVLQLDIALEEAAPLK
jgi:K+-transporting ATPase ATPase C chain